MYVGIFNLKEEMSIRALVLKHWLFYLNAFFYSYERYILHFMSSLTLSALGTTFSSSCNTQLFYQSAPGGCFVPAIYKRSKTNFRQLSPFAKHHSLSTEAKLSCLKSLRNGSINGACNRCYRL